jgi:uncharacterized protein with PIN domain
MPETDWPRISSSRSARFELRGRLAAMGRLPSPVDLTFREDQNLRHLAEILGIPATEIGQVYADGSSWPLELPPPDGSNLLLYPVQEPLRVSQRPRFLSDDHLGRLARELRLLGFDSILREHLSDDEYVETAIAEERAILSRDRALLFRRDLAVPPRGQESGESAPRPMLVLSTDPYDQLLEVCLRFGLAALWNPLCLCSRCGGGLRPIPKDEALPRLPKVVAERYEDFRICPSCGQLYWKGDHARSIEPLLERLRADLTTNAPGDRAN